MFSRDLRTGSLPGRCAGDVPGGGSFAVVDSGAHVTHWTPDGEPVLFLSSRAEFAPGRPIRGGVPVCFPWFGPGRDGQSRPAHGWARTLDWTLSQATEVDGVTTLEWRLTDADVVEAPGLTRWGHSFEATCRQRFDSELTLDFTVRNTGNESFDYEAALHTYFRVGDVAQVIVEGLGGADYWDKLTGQTQTQIGDLQLTDRTDRVYASAADTRIVDPVLERTITVAKAGSATTVVWNPWEAEAANIADLGEGEWREFLCVETANTGADAVRLAPGQLHTMTVRLTVAKG